MTIDSGQDVGDHPFLRPRQPMFWVYCGLIALAAFQVASVFGPYIASTPVVFAVTFVVNGMLAFLFIRLINWLDLFERAPVSLLTAAFVWGGVGAVGFAMHTNDTIAGIFSKLGATDWQLTIAAPIDEELFKTAGLIAIVVIGRRFIVRPMDGLVLGMMCGLGFEVVENVLYGVQTAVTDVNDDMAAAVTVTMARVLLGVGSHVMYSGIVGLGIGYAVTRSGRPVGAKALVVAGTFLLAWALHFLWDAPVGDAILVTLAKYLLVVVAFFLLYRYAARREWDWFVAVMAAEPSSIITQSELESMKTLRGRRRARKSAKSASGGAAKRHIRFLQDAQLAYAIAVDGSRRPEHDREVKARRDEILSLRSSDEEAQIRERAAAMSGG